MENLDKLVLALCKLPSETSWLEFKHNNDNPEMIGQDIGALANSAVLAKKNCAYMIWGVDDATHEILGTTFNFRKQRKNGQELESWLRHRLTRNAEFEFDTVSIEGKTVGVLVVHCAAHQTVKFEKVEYVRVGSYTKKLMEYPELQAKLWGLLRDSVFEDRCAKQDLDLPDALRLLDYSKYFDMSGLPQPIDAQGVGHYLLADEILAKQDNGLYAITNLGAILFAKKLSDFPRLARKATRVVQYEGNGRLNLLRENVEQTGYIVGFERLIEIIQALIPAREPITGALRGKETAYPALAVREMVANALVHQDFSITGTGPVIEIFDSRIEITNPGVPLVNINRIIDNPPKSRNEKLASLMRRFRICEELGTGWDKIVNTCELAQLPSPKITLFQESTRVALYAAMDFSNISREDRLRACYYHACIKYIQGEQLTNASLRNRFGLQESSSANVSRLIKDAIKEKLIKPLAFDTAPRYMKYIPHWA